jgi:KTSC domain
MPSTVIRRFDYSPERQELEILFTTGRRYLYSGVPEEAARSFRAAFAKGVHFNRYIRDRFPCRELDPTT